MNLAFARAEARLAASLARVMTNATASIDGAAAVPCDFTSMGDVSRLGEHGYQVRGVSIVVASADAAAASEGVAVSVTYRGNVTPWQVRERLPDDVHLQRTTLLLEQVPA